MGTPDSYLGHLVGSGKDVGRHRGKSQEKSSLLCRKDRDGVGTIQAKYSPIA